MPGNAIIGQSGGPTSVINASLEGVMRAAAQADEIDTLYGMRCGIEGFMREELYDLSAQPERVVAGLSTTPSSALGSSRHKLRDDELPRIRELMGKYDIRYFFLIGGNDTMDTLHRVGSHARETGYELHSLGIPKTVDNDLFGTDHTPGFPSAARYNILSVRQGGRLARDMRKVDGFVIYQTVGRDAGWLAAATALARDKKNDPPHLIYCPELPFHREEFLDDAKAILERQGWLSIVVSEGLKYPGGGTVSAAEGRDGFGNVEYGSTSGSSVGMNVHRILTEATGLRGEFQIPESLPMCAADRVLQGDRDRALECGKEAVRLAVSGETGFMVSIERGDGCFGYGRVPLHEVAVRAKAMPREFLNERGNGITPAFLEYMKPLSEPLPRQVSLESIFVKEDS